MNKRVAYVHNADFLAQSDDFIPTKQRNQMVHALVEACGLLEAMTVVTPEPASFEQLSHFHCREYLKCLQDRGEKSDSDDEAENEFGFGYDCPLTANVFHYCQQIAGGSLTGARLLCDDDCDVAIHWLGGWHHAQRSQASGYCYVNDCVLAVLRLREKFQRVLYVDLDLHHGNGVQDAFSATSRVMTFSVHKFESGFFPGSGGVGEVGYGKGKFYSVNLPLKEGVRDRSFSDATVAALSAVHKSYRPDAVVCQLGADGLNEDPMASFNLTPASFCQILTSVLGWGVPLLMLGGGGYHDANVARCWCQLTACVVGKHLPSEIPEHRFFDRYGPSFEFQVSQSLRKDCNSESYLDEMLERITDNLSRVKVVT